MAIIQSITSHGQFADAFMRMGRGKQFTAEALGALFDYYDDIGEDVELDPIAICCDWSEYDSALDACAEYGIEYGIDDDMDQTARNACEALRDRTAVLTPDNGSVVVQAF